MQIRKHLFFLIGLICISLGGYELFYEPVKAVITTAATPLEEELDERLDGSFFSLYDLDSQDHIEHMSRIVNEEDELITSDNKHYRVMKIEGDNAHCQYLGDVGYEYTPALANEAITAAKEQQPYQAVAIYTTHTDESYVPSSGTESKEGGGDILDVASVLAQSLEEQGVHVLHSDNIHDPHDKNAYQRSRETAAQLLQGAPAIMIDVHRDGVPDPEYYEAELDGKNITQIRLVVGKQNENNEANLEFAEKMKAYYDSVKPGLIKSIYLAKGNYNQDMAPHSILLEIGTHTNTLEEAEAGAAEFASVLPDFLGIASNETAPTPFVSKESPQENQKDMSSNKASKVGLILVGLLLVGGAAFMFINKGAGHKE